ncbi:hypothetical protein WKH57_00925 [Niallia taxi]|uniref:hypothetical protein n=1 Tax=Niallia taxi TaxID=2499688 RepID=UPI003180B7B6
MDDNCPNVMIVPPNEPVEDIIEDYVAMLEYNIKHGVSVEEVLLMFFEDINTWTAKQMLIDNAKQTLQDLENLHKFENSLFEEIDDED